MASGKYNSIHTKLYSLIEKGSLHIVFKTMREMISSNTEPAIADSLNRLEDTYKYMIHYLIEGYQDNGRNDVLSGIKDELHSLNDRLLRDAVIKDSSDIYSSTKRFINIRKENLKSLINEIHQIYPEYLLAGAPTVQEYSRKNLMIHFPPYSILFGLCLERNIWIIISFLMKS